MKLTIIGRWGAYPAPNEATSAYLLQKDNFNLLIDIGSGALSALQNSIDVMDIDAVIVSHYHHDHIADVGVLQYAWLVQSILREHDEILPIYGHMEDEKGFASLTSECTEGIAYDPDGTLQIGPFSITFMKTIHPVPCYGMRITDGEVEIVYTADTSYTENWVEFCEYADLLIADCNFYADQDGKNAGHMTSKEVGIIAERAQVKELILSHLPHYGNHEDLLEEAKAQFTKQIYVAEKGLVWTKK